MTNLLIEILNNITVNKWCFNYNGACSTCGMAEVKNELNKYTIDEIVDGFKNLDFENKEVQKNIVGLEKLFSLMTGPYTVWNDRGSIEALKDFFKSNKNTNPYIKRLKTSDYKTFWDNWSLQQHEWEKGLDDQVTRAKERGEFESSLIKNDVEDRNSGLREKLIEQLNEMTIYEKLVFMSNDTKHTPKYYPGNIAYHTTQEDIDKLDSNQYENISKMFNMYIKGNSPWGKFKKRFLNGR